MPVVTGKMNPGEHQLLSPGVIGELLCHVVFQRLESFHLKFCKGCQKKSSGLSKGKYIFQEVQRGLQNLFLFCMSFGRRGEPRDHAESSQDPVFYGDIDERIKGLGKVRQAFVFVESCFDEL